MFRFNKIKCTKRFFSALLVLNFSIFAFSYSLEDLKSAMAQNNPELLKLQAEYDRSLLDVKDAWAGIGPTVDLQLTGTYLINPPIDAVYINVDDILNSIQWPSGLRPTNAGQYVKVYDGMENTLYNFQLSVMQPIFTWGKLSNAVKLYNQIADIKQTQLLSKQQQMDMELETRLITLSFLQKILTILDEEKTYAERLVQVSESAEKSGMLLHQDVVEARIQAKELEIAQRDLGEQIANQLLELQRATGIENLSLNQIDYKVSEERILDVLEGNREIMQENALSSSKLSIKLLTQLKEVNVTAEKIAKGYVYWKPDVALQASAGYGGSRLPFVEKNWLRKDDYTTNISIGIKTTIWDGGKKLHDVARKNSEVKTADINQLDARVTIKQTLNSQWNTIDVCTMKIEYQDLKIETAESKIKQVETVYQTGYGSESDVLSAKISCCNEQIEKVKQTLSRAVACMTVEFLTQKN